MSRYKYILIAFATFAAFGCKPSVEPETPVEPRLLSIATTQDYYIIEPDASVEVCFSVEEPRAFFNYAVSLSDCQVLLRIAGQTVSPQEFSITRITEGAAKGDYVAVLTDNGTSTDYNIDVTIDIKDASNTVVRSNIITVSTNDALSSIESLRFLRSDNPQLASDVEMIFDSSTATYSGRTTTYLTDTRLIARFECKGKVDVGGVELISGETVNDFGRAQTLRVSFDGHISNYTVRLTNFTGLPVVTINTPGGRDITSKDIWIEGATFAIDGVGRFADIEECTMAIKGRGNTTWGWPKKPYNIKLDEKHKLLGMHNDRRWCLIANFMDRTLLRNRVAYYIGNQTSLAWTPQGEFVELFLNGKHLGQYLLMEKIRIDNNRIDITEMTPNDNAGESVTGGYLFELDFHYDNVWQWYSAHGTPFSVVEPDDDQLTADQLAWAKKHIAEVENVIYGSDFADPTNGYAKYIDSQSFIDYWLVYEVCVNHELGNPGSVFIHKDRGGKLVAGPLWDFDWGTFSYNASPHAKTEALFIKWAWWYSRLFDDEAFWQLARDRWRVLKPKIETSLAFLDQEAAYIEYSAAENFKLWNPAEDGYINGDENMTWNSAVARMRTILSERIALIDSVLSNR